MLSKRGRVWALIACGVVIFFAMAIAVTLIRFRPMARDYVISSLRERYRSDVELGDFDIALFPSVRATGNRLVLRGKGLISVRRFTFYANLPGFLRSPRHVGRLELEGLEIHLPPRSEQRDHGDNPKASFVLDEVIADGAVLEMAPKDSAKAPLRFQIEQVTVHGAGAGQPMAFHAELNNPKPPGLIHSDGSFGPWNAGDPATTPVSGRYTFRDADLSVFKGIRGTLSSDGSYQGQLGSIQVEGSTDVPDFALTSGEHGVHLKTQFEATVDGTNGNTRLHPVRAQLAESEFEVSGTIERDAPGQKKAIQLETQGHGGHIEDFLRLALKGQAPMTGGVQFQSKVVIPPGDANVIDRLQLNGNFTLDRIRFTSPDVEGKIAGLSHRAQGEPEDTSKDVRADFSGRFLLRDGRLNLPDLRFSVPGARVSLAGDYVLRSGVINFSGTAKLDATISEMTTGFKRILLKPLDPLFKRGDAGAVLPIMISGTRGAPSFKLDIGRVLKRK